MPLVVSEEPDSSDRSRANAEAMAAMMRGEGAAPIRVGSVFCALPPGRGPGFMSEVSDYVTIETAANEAVADLIRQRLDEGGVPCVLVPGNTVAIAGAGAAFSITVPRDRADEARRLLSG